MKHFRALRRAILAALLMTTAALAAEPAPLPDKPFAEHRIVLQLSDNDAAKQGLVISVANNLLKHYDPDKVAIEVVAFGPGIALLFPGNSNRARVESLVAQDENLVLVERIPERSEVFTGYRHREIDSGDLRDEEGMQAFDADSVGDRGHGSSGC